MIYDILISFDAPGYKLTLIFVSCKHHKSILLVILFLMEYMF